MPIPSSSCIPYTGPPLSILLSSAGILRAPDAVGPKARALARLTEKGFHIPAFLAVPADAATRILADPAIAEELASEARIDLAERRFAVRSAAFSEECVAGSRAGAYRRELDVSPEKLAEAIRLVAADAVAKGETRFSLIIQAFIPCSLSGVTFTRSPLGKREMTVEWHTGPGPDRGSGKGQLQRVAFHRTQPLPRTGLPDFAYAVREWRRIEDEFGAPQIIEWGVWKKDWYVLQSRPVASQNPAHFRLHRLLDAALPSKPFLYEKNEVTEMAPRPTPITLSLLRRIYRAGGPLDRAYGELGYRYRAEDFLVLVAGQLSINREKELRTILPSLSLTRSGAPALRRLTGFWTTVHNTRATQRLDPAASRAELCARLIDWLSRAETVLTLPDALVQFDEAYAVIATIDVCAARALSALLRTTQGQQVHIPALLTTALVPQDPLPPPPQRLIGNSLELADLSPFFPARASLSPHFETTRWWEALLPQQRSILEPLLATAQTYCALREAGRWLTVTLVHALRQGVLRSAEAAGWDQELAWYATLEEHLSGAPDPARAAKRRDERASYADLTLPARLSHHTEGPDVRNPTGVSAGTATGLLVTPETLASASGPLILAVPTLSPDLTRHFGRIGGIVAEHGGLLSHLAIIARERRVPVVTNFLLTAQSVRPGDIVEVNGTTGEVRVLQRKEWRD